MKTSFTIGVAFLFSIPSFGQITLEHTYSDAQAIVLSWGQSGYQTYDSNNLTWKHYDANHQLIRTINIPSIPDFELLNSQPVYYGINFFSLSGEFEYLVTYYNMTSGDRIHKVYYGNGVEVFTRTCNGCAAILGNVDGESKLLIYTTDWSEVYALEGDWPLVDPSGMNEYSSANSGYQLYPNPANTMVTIDAPGPGTIELFDLLGQQVDSYSTDTKGAVSFSAVRFQSGTYLVNWNGMFLEKLVIR